ncbi:hypothetical protein KQX54_021636 [Cotesia glomerata]|uniref:Uncharacterized protein n=1 Tax=Cotesia glomerata TaxID=32391 RepID=A0AAV7IWK5_COTGL|nr:hypothetical protein KQX54_021636 [Cotesia glomerata]
MRRKNGPFSDLSVSFFTSSSTIPLYSYLLEPQPKIRGSFKKGTVNTRLCDMRHFTDENVRPRSREHSTHMSPVWAVPRSLTHTLAINKFIPWLFTYVWKFTPQLAELNAVDNSEKITKTRKIAQLYKEKPRFTSPCLSGTSNLLCRVEFAKYSSMYLESSLWWSHWYGIGLNVKGGGCVDIYVIPRIVFARSSRGNSRSLDKEEINQHPGMILRNTRMIFLSVLGNSLKFHSSDATSKAFPTRMLHSSTASFERRPYITPQYQCMYV